jgi:hypothetical protein
MGRTPSNGVLPVNKMRNAYKKVLAGVFNTFSVGLV